MRNVISYTLSQDFGYTLGIENAPYAVLVYPSTGDVILREGPAGTFDGVAVEGGAISGFWVDLKEGELVIGFTFRRGKRIESHILGRVKDKESAEAWVNRVNTIYNSKHHEPTEDFQILERGRYRDNPVVHDLLTTQIDTILPGDYLRSMESYPAPEYRPYWQDYYVESSLYHLQRITGEPTRKIQRKWLHAPEHRYPYLAERIKYGPQDFKNRIIQPLEMMFERGPRLDKIGVLPLATADEFACVFIRTSIVESAMQLKHEEHPYDSFNEWLDSYADATASGTRKFVICTPSDTSVDYMINDVKLHGQRLALKTHMPSISTLSDWLINSQGVVVCDVGIAKQIEHFIRVEKQMPYLQLGVTYVPYDNPVSVGLAYRVDDDLWGCICNQALADCFSSSDEKILESLDDTRNRVSELGMKWLNAA